LGDHICYSSDVRRFKTDYPSWSIIWSLDDILRELVGRPAAVLGRGAAG